MKAPRGTRDFGPHEMSSRRAVEARLRRVLEAYGYGEVQTPTFEHLELFTAKSGPGIVDELYAFEDKSGRRLALRPELTAAVMRHYFQSLKMEPKPVRLYYFANCFRYDRPQAGRYREFWQLGCERIGDASDVGLAELVAAAVGLVEEAGLRHWVLRLGHLEVLRAVLQAHGVAREAQASVMRHIDKRDMVGLRNAVPPEAVATLQRLFEATTLEDLSDLVPAGPARQAMASLAAVLEHLSALGVPRDRVRLDAGIARGLDYYNGIVFELDAPRLGAEKQLLGGGAYDLADAFGEPDVPCAGFALGFDRTLLALAKEEVALPGRPAVDVYAAVLDAAAWPQVLATAAALRRGGARVEVDAAVRTARKALARAAQLGAGHAVVAGAREAVDGTVAVKDLVTGDQVTVAPHEAAAQWKRHPGPPAATTPTTPP